jgi:DedD protein
VKPATADAQNHVAAATVAAKVPAHDGSASAKMASPPAKVTVPVAKVAQPTKPVSASAPKVALASQAEPAPAAFAQADGAWFVQLGSFASKANADRLIGTLKAKGYAVKVTVLATPDLPLYRVRVGPQADKVRADALNARLKRDGHGGVVTSLP